MSAKIVNLIQFVELKIAAEVKMEGFAFGSPDDNAVVARFYLVDIGP